MLTPIETISGLNLSGQCGKLLRNVQNNWLIGIAETNPAILAMFRDRDALPYRDLLPWSGEFAGKYITGACLVYRATHSAELLQYVSAFIEKLSEYIDDDGYIGCYSKECRLTGAFSQKPGESGQTWDCWSHYHIMYGLYLWYRETGDAKLLGYVEKIARLFLKTFHGTGKRVADIGFTEMNLAPLHIFALLYGETGKREYLDFALELLDDAESDKAGQYLRYIRGGYEYYQCPKPRWESLHIIMGILQLSECLGDDSYFDAASAIFYSILKTDVHNTGGFSSGEQAIGNPFENLAIELCCVVAYNALAVEVYLRNGDPAIIDFLERSYCNAIIGSYSPTGCWSTYNTPMEGVKKANYHDIVFQSRPGSPELNCCSANSGRGVGELCRWAFVREPDGALLVNFYESCRFETPDGVRVEIKGDYPADGDVRISVFAPDSQITKLRIPAWSGGTRAVVNGSERRAPGGSQLMFSGSAEVELHLDMSPRFIDGGGAYSGKRSILCGPVLFGADVCESGGAALTDELLSGRFPHRRADGSIGLDAGGVSLTDFYHIGQDGREYATWFSR